MIRNTLTESEKETCRKFEAWLKKTFNSGCLLANRPVPFSARFHNDANGNLLIDNGNMTLQPNDFIKKDESEGISYQLVANDGSMICYGQSLERVLLDGLQHAMHREFVRTYA